MEETPPGRSMLIMAVVFEGALLALAWWLGHLWDVPVGAQLTLSAWALAAGVVATIPLLGGLYWLLHTRWDIVARLRALIEDTVAPLFADCSVVGLAVISLLAGVGEEALFRGVLQTVMAGSIGVVPALLVVSTLFGLVHPVSVAYAAMAGLIGLYLGLLTLWSGTLVPAVTAHALYDFVALTYLVRSGRLRAEAVAATD